MFFDKQTYKVPIKAGQGTFNTKDMRGMVVLFIVRPESEDTQWSLTVLDKEDDEIIEIKDHTGRFERDYGLPLGKDTQETVTFKFFNVTKNENIKVMLKTREIGG